MTVSKVKCSVTNCAYNEKYRCSASGVEVNAVGDGYALTSDGTSCQTFVSRK